MKLFMSSSPAKFYRQLSSRKSNMKMLIIDNHAIHVVLQIASMNTSRACFQVTTAVHGLFPRWRTYPLLLTLS